MTAKEQLRERIQAFTEREAERMLDDLRGPLTELLEAPLDDEPVTASLTRIVP